MVTQECVDIIKKFEGYRPVVYLDPVGVPTSGFGHTAGLTMNMVGMPITMAQAEAWLKEDLAKFEKRVDKYDPIYHWTSNERSALISFAYNVGSIDKLTAKGTRSKKEIAQAMLSFNKAKGKVLNGLTKRRQAERELFLSGGIQTTPTKIYHPILRRGAQGEAVGELQRLLGIKEDKIFGIVTETAVKIFQQEHGLEMDGVVGQNTWAELLK